MTLIECTSTREIPSVELCGYSLGNGYTVDTAIQDYRKRFGVEPVLGWHWGNYVYIALPE